MGSSTAATVSFGTLKAVIGASVVFLVVLLAFYSVAQSDTPILVANDVRMHASTASPNISDNFNFSSPPANEMNELPLERFDFTQRVFPDSDLKTIWSKYVKKPDDYYARYEWLSNGTWFPSKHDKERYWNDRSVCRVIECAEFERLVNEFNATHSQSCLTLGGRTDPELEYIDCNLNRTDVPYRPNDANTAEGDLFTLDLPFKEWDFILLNQQMEHIYDPFKAFANVYRHLKPGGYLWATIPIINVPHMVPIHFYHFQPMALATLSLGSGFKILEVGYWGNFDYIDTIFHKRWPNWHYYVQFEPMKSQHHFAVQTWALLQKPMVPNEDGKPLI